MLTYCLQCEGPAYYVGRTKDLHRRLRQHWSGRGARWVALHPPIRLLEVRAHDVERQTTLEYMRLYGWNIVRGGPWTTVRSIGKPRDLEEEKTMATYAYDGPAL